MSAMVSWLIEYHEGWYGPRAQWNKKQRDDFDAKAGFLMLFIDGFKFTKENAKVQGTAVKPQSTNEEE